MPQLHSGSPFRELEGGEAMSEIGKIRYQCICGSLNMWAKEDEQPPLCIVCLNCGSTLAAAGSSHQPPVKHKWQRYVGQHIYLKCLRCKQCDYSNLGDLEI